MLLQLPSVITVVDEIAEAVTVFLSLESVGRMSKKEPGKHRGPQNRWPNAT